MVGHGGQFLCIVICSLASCQGWIRSAQIPRNTRLYSSNQDPDRKVGSKVSRYNEKVLNDAKRLRDQINLLEEQSRANEQIQKAPPAFETTDAKVDADMSRSGGKSFGDDFVSRFPIERAMNSTSIFTLGSFKSDPIAVAILDATPVLSGQYVSVLVDRVTEKSKKEVFLDKITGMLVTNNTDATSGTLSSANFQNADESVEMMRMKRNAPTQRPLPAVKPQEMGASIIAAFQLSIETQMQVKLEKAGRSYNPSDYPKPLPSSVLTPSLESSLLVVTGQDGTEKYELRSTESMLKDAGATWVPKLLLKLFLFIMLSSVDRKLFKNKDDVRILEASFASCIIDFEMMKDEAPAFDANMSESKEEYSLKKELDYLSYLRDTVYKAFLKADWIKYKLRGELPSVAGLQLLIADQTSQSDDLSVDMLTLWRMTTVDRLVGVSDQVLSERDAVWGMKVVAPVVTVVVDSIVAVAPPISPTVVEKGLLNRFNAYLDKQVVSAESDLAEVLGDKDGWSEQGQDIIFGLVQGKGTLSPALQALKNALNSTQEKKIDVASLPSTVEPLVVVPSVSTVDELRVSLNANSTADRLEIDLPGISEAKLGELSKLSSTELKDLFDDSALSSLIGTFGALEELGLAQDERSTTAECFVSDYFDIPSKTAGLVISREGAGRFQLEMLKDLFVVSSVKTSQGAIIFSGKYKTKTPAEFSDRLEKRYSSSRMSDEVGYTIMTNSILSTDVGGQQQQALDRILGESPAVVLYPKTWTTNLDLYGKSKWRRSLSLFALLTSIGFSAGAFGMFNNGSPFLTSGAVPIDLLPMALLPMGIQYSSMAVERLVGKSKGFNVTSVILPSLSLLTYGTRSVYTTMPKSRSDMFDTAAAGITFALVCSFVAMYVGVQLTTTATADVLATYPTVSLTLMSTNTVVRQLLSLEFSWMFPYLADVKRATDLISGGNGEGGGDVPVHLHWLAISGAVSFMANIFQLIPVDNSAGSKMAGSVIGKNDYSIFMAVFSILKAVFVLPVLFTMSSSSLLSPPRLITDYFITSAIHGNGQVCS